MPATIEYFPFDNQASYEAQWRDMAQTWRTTGIIPQGNNLDATGGDCAVEPGTGLQIKIAVGRAWIQGHYFKHTDDYAYLPISSNSSGSTRTDLVVVRADFTANTISYQVLQGTTTPVQSSTVWDLELARVSVPNGAVSISAGNITDRRIPSTAGFVPAAKVHRATSQSIPSGNETMVSFSTAIYDNCRAWDGATKLTAPRTGYYMLTMCCGWGSSASGTRIHRIRKNGSTYLAEDQWQPGAASQARTTATVARLNKGDYVEASVYQSSGGDLGTGSVTESYPAMTMTYLGE